MIRFENLLRYFSIGPPMVLNQSVVECAELTVGIILSCYQLDRFRNQPLDFRSTGVDKKMKQVGNENFVEPGLQCPFTGSKVLNRQM